MVTMQAAKQSFLISGYEKLLKSLIMGINNK